MRIIRILGNIALWAGACLGIIAGGVWIADQAGWIQPLIVISGSMEPGINTGDLLFDRPAATEDLEVGDIVSIHSDLTGNLVTHRVIAIKPQGDLWEIRMQGDANPQEDIEPYLVGDEVLRPAARIPGAGNVVSKLMNPAVALPILLALVALLGLSLLDEPAAARVDESTTDDDPDDDDPHHDVQVRGELDGPLDENVPAVGSASLDELDEMLIALGIDVDHFEDTTGPDTATTQPAATEAWVDGTDDRELILTG